MQENLGKSRAYLFAAGFIGLSLLLSFILNSFLQALAGRNFVYEMFNSLSFWTLIGIGTIIMMFLLTTIIVIVD